MTKLATVGAVLTLTCAPVAASAEPGEEVVATTLTAIRSNAEAFKAVWVSFPIQFSAIGELHNPFFTRFVSTDYTNFHGWADDQPIWRKPEYDDVFGLLFMSKKNPQLSQLVQLRTYQRVKVTGIVRNTFQGQPWIEVTEMEPLEGQVDTATLSHLFRGERHMNERRWKLAITELSLAPAEGVPAEVRAAVHRNLGVCYLRLGEASNAANHLYEAIALLEGRYDPEAQRLLLIAETDPQLGLDRAVDRQAVQDGDRPLWEAFAPAAPPR